MIRPLLLFLALLLAGCVTPLPEKPKRFVELKGAEAETYERLAWRHWKRTNIVLSVAEQNRIHAEVFGTLAIDNSGNLSQPEEVMGGFILGGVRQDRSHPSQPEESQCRVMLDTWSGQNYAAFGIGKPGYGTLGYFELEFTRTQPPKVVDTYFTDRGRTVRLPTYKALYRLGTERWHRGEVTLATFPGNNGFDQ